MLLLGILCGLFAALSASAVVAHIRLEVCDQLSERSSRLLRGISGASGLVVIMLVLRLCT
jgi:hypothetical protein